MTAYEWCFVVWHGMDRLKLHLASALALAHWTCSVLLGPLRSVQVLIGRSGPTQWQPVAHRTRQTTRTDHPCLGVSRAHPSWPSERGLPNGRRRSAAPSPQPTAHGGRRRLLGRYLRRLNQLYRAVQAASIDNKRWIAARCRPPSQAHLPARRIQFLLLETKPNRVRVLCVRVCAFASPCLGCLCR